MHYPLAIQSTLDKLPWRVSHALRRFIPETYGYFHVIAHRPLIVLIPEDFADERERWNPFFHALKDNDVTFLCLIRGALEARGAVGFDNTHAVWVEHRASYPKHKFIYLANSELQRSMLCERDLEAVFFNQNALADERLFTVQHDVAKRHDAIYNARIHPYKRHYLASKVESLALITIIDARTTSDYFDHIAYALKHAAWLNFPDHVPTIHQYRRITFGEIGAYLNPARVGLCLSETEGAMFASIEYLLCGLPVVTTRSFGGRDIFFDAEYVVFVDDSPEAVREGVQQLILANVPADYIRARTLEKIGEHRRRFIELVQKTCDAEGIHPDYRELYNATFPSQIYSTKRLHSILGYL